jgi:hypothetical protein
MSSYLSSEYKIQQPVSSFNVNLADNVLSTLQGKYDTNKAKIDQTLAVYNNQLRGLRAEDNEYIANRLNEVDSVIEQYKKKNGNLAYNSTTDTILSTVKSLMDDPIIKDAVKNKAYFDNYEKQVQEIKKKDPKMYNDRNYQYGLYKGGYQAYMKGEVKSIANMQYSNFSDYDGKINDFVKDLEGKKKGETIQYRDNAGGIAEVVIDGLSPIQLRQIAKSALNEDDNKQIEIDGWANTGGYSDKTKIFSEVGLVMDTNTKETQEEINKLKVALKNGGLTPEQKEATNKEIISFEANIETNRKNKEVLSSNIEVAATFLQREKVLDNATLRFSPLYTKSTTYKKDEEFYAKRQDARDEARLDIDQKKLLIAQEKLQLDKDAANGVTDAKNMIIVPKAVDDQKDINVESEIDKTIVGLSSEIDTTSNSFRSRVEELASQGDEEATLLLSEYKKNLKKGRSKAEAFNIAVESKVDSGWDLADEQDSQGNYYYSTINDRIQKRDTYVIGKQKIDRKAEEEHFTTTVDSQEAFSAFKDNPNTKILWKSKDGVERGYSVAQVLISNGIMDKEGKKLKNISDYPALKEAVMKSYYADAALTGRDQASKWLKLGAMLGEDYSKVIVKGQRAVSDRTGGAIIPTENLNPNSKTAKYLANAEKNGLGDKFEALDQSLSGDDSTIGRFINTNPKNSEGYKQDLKNLWGKLPQSFTVSISDKDKYTYGRLADYIQTQGATDVVKGNLNASNPYNISLDSTGKNVIISQYDVEGKEKTTALFEAKTDINTFKTNFPNLVKKIDLDSPQAHYTKERVTTEDLTTKSIKFNVSSTERAKVKRIKQEAGLDVGRPVTKEESLAVVGNPVAMYFGKDSQELLNLKKAIEQSNNFSIQGVPNKNGAVLKVNLVNSRGNVVYTEEVEDLDNYDNIKKVIDYSPQTLYTDLLTTIFLEHQLKSKSSYGESSEYYTNFIKNLK